MTDKIAETLGIEPKEIIRPPKIKSLVPNQDEFTQQLIKNKLEDYTEVRDNIKNLIAEVDSVIGDAVMEVRSNPSARMYESFCQLVQVYSNINNQLLKMHTEEKSSQRSNDDNPNPAAVNNVLFVGTSDSLIDHIRTNVKIL